MQQLKCNPSKDVSISVETKKMNDFDLTPRIINVDGGRQLKKVVGPSAKKVICI